MKLRIQLGKRADREAGGPEGLGRPLTASLFLHGLLALAAVFGGVLLAPGGRHLWGEAGLGGGVAVPVNLMPSVPLPATRGPENPLASPTKEYYPAEPKRPERAAPPRTSARDFEELKEKLRRLERERAREELAGLKRQREIPDNALPGSTSSGRASSPVYGMATGQGSGGIGFSGDFGSLYGWYVSAVKSCIARHWDRSRVDASIHSAPRVYVEFDIQRNGIMTGERMATSSNIPSVDRAALRAVQGCSGRSDVGADSKLPDLPRDYAGKSVRAEVWFEFKK